MDYKLIVEIDIGVFEKTVGELLKQGYRFIESLQHAVVDGQIYYIRELAFAPKTQPGPELAIAQAAPFDLRQN